MPELETPSAFKPTADEEKKVNDLVKAIEAEQTSFVASNNKYKQIKSVEDDGVTKEVIEYVCPDKSVGYQVILKMIKDEKNYVKSIGYGPEAESRTFDWTEIKEDELI